MSTKPETASDLTGATPEGPSDAAASERDTLTERAISAPSSPSSEQERAPEAALPAEETFDTVFGLGADAAELGADVMAVGRTYLATAAQFVQAEIDDLTEALSGGSAACDQYVHERPWSAAAAAGAVGFVLGLVLSKAFVRRR